MSSFITLTPAGDVPLSAGMDDSNTVLVEIGGQTRRMSREGIAAFLDLGLERPTDGRNYASRQAFLDDITATSYAPADGTVVTADGLSYLRKSGATDILDLPGWIPTGIIYAEHFGAKGDMTWRQLTEGDLTGINAGTYGPQRITGTNDIEAFRAALAYASSLGGGEVVAPGDYYLLNYTRITSDGSRTEYPTPCENPAASEVMVHLYDGSADVTGLEPGEAAEEQHTFLDPSEYTVSGSTVTLNTAPADGVQVEVCVDFSIPENVTLRFGGTIWTQYALPQIGASVSKTGARLMRTKHGRGLVIGQFSYNGFKPADNGQLGPVVASTTGYYTNFDQAPIDFCEYDVEVSRAARVLGDAGVSFQDSDGSILTSGVGFVRYHKHRVKAGPRTNVVSFILNLQHWSGRYVPPGGAETINKTPYAIADGKKYLPEGGYLEVVGEVDGADHGMSRIFELANTTDMRVGDVTGRNLEYLYWVGPGDLAGAFTNPLQANRENKGNRGGRMTGYNIGSDGGLYACYCKGEGSSKFEDYPGTSIKLVRASKHEWSCDGHHLECVAGTVEAIRLRGVNGTIDLGDCYLAGATKALLAYSGNGKWKANITGGTGAIHIWNNKGGTLLGTSLDMGSNRGNTDTGFYNTGYEADNAAIHLQGATYSTTLTAAVAAGDTTCEINAFTDGLADATIGDRIVAFDGSNRQETRIRALSIAGAKTLYTDPWPVAVPSGTTIQLDVRSSVDYLNANFQSSEFGIVCDDSDILNLDLTGIGYTGRYCLDLNGRSTAHIVARIPGAQARRVVSTSRQAILVDINSRVTAMNVEIPNGDTAANTFQVASNGTKQGSVVLVGCRIQAAGNLAADSAQLARIKKIGCIDFNGGDIT